MAGTPLTASVAAFALALAVGCTKRVSFEQTTPIAVIAAPRPAPPTVRDDAIVVHGKLELAPDGKLAPRTLELLNAAAATSHAHPEITTLVVEGEPLTPAQVDVVLAYLVAHGAPAGLTIASDERQVLAPAEPPAPDAEVQP
ncbi:MAG TPA: hypothetical protein VFQ53_06845 [Kofleriaceae bacterium]|nr:hypothetical protein [Kofleriaceae bacterium]